MSASRLFFRGVCLLCGVLGFGIFILAAARGGWSGLASHASSSGWSRPHL